MSGKMVLTDESKKWLYNQFEGSVKFDEPMNLHTYFKIGGPADAFVVPDSKKKLICLVKWCNEKKIPFVIIGNGSNLLVKDLGIRGIVISLAKCLNKISLSWIKDGAANVRAMAGVKLQRLCRYAQNRGFAGLNFALGIPASVGGGIMMNAGTANGCMADIIKKLIILSSNGKIMNFVNNQLDFSYRKLSFKTETNKIENPIILEGYFALNLAEKETLITEGNEILRQRIATQPMEFASPGCIFKNPKSGPPAGRLIDEAGLKGMREGNAIVSPKHANFIINMGNAKAFDVLFLMEKVKNIVFKKFNIDLEPEVKIVGE